MKGLTKMNTEINHYGKWINSEKPITGVISNHTAQWLYEESYNAIDLDYTEFAHEIENDDLLSEDEKQIALDNYESMGDNTLLIGSWLQDEKGLYYPDPDSEYAAIMRESVTQVVWSQFTKKCALCSPCYPGQGDLDSKGDYLAYDLPVDIY